MTDLAEKSFRVFICIYLSYSYSHIITGTKLSLFSFPDPVSRNEEFSGKIATEDLHQTTKSPDTPLNYICPLCSRAFDTMLCVSPCLHSFCFSCTRDLLETKAKCPSCKQPFRSVSHPVNVALKELPSGKGRKEKFSFSPSRKKPKEHGLLYSPKNLDKYSSLPPRSQSEDPIALSCEEYPPSKLHFQRHCKCSPRWLSKDDLTPCEFTNFQPPSECHHMRVLGKKPKSDHVSIQIEEPEGAFRSPANALESGNNDLENFRSRIAAINLSMSGFLEATFMLISSGAMLFICVFIYLELVLLRK